MNAKIKTLLILGLVVLLVLAVVLSELAPQKETALLSADTVIQSCAVSIKDENGEMVSLEIDDLRALTDCLASCRIAEVDRTRYGPFHKPFQGVYAAIEIVFLEPDTQGFVNVWLGESSIVLKEDIIYEITNAEAFIKRIEDLFGVDAGIDKFVPYEPLN